MIIKGFAHIFGNNINTDGIIPARYCMTIDYKELASHCLEDVDDNFRKNVLLNDIIVAGKNFGCGSSREVAPIAIKHAGVSCVIAESFARIFYRNSYNIGLPLIEIPDITKHIRYGDAVKVDFENNIIINLTLGETIKFTQETGILNEIVRAGGLLNYIKETAQ